MKLYKGDECFNLFKEMYYRYCNYSVDNLKEKIESLYPDMEYANDYVGIQVKTISLLIYLKTVYTNELEESDKLLLLDYDNDEWFNVFIKQDILNKNILIRNGIKMEE